MSTNNTVLFLLLETLCLKCEANSLHFLRIKKFIYCSEQSLRIVEILSNNYI